MPGATPISILETSHPLIRRATHSKQSISDEVTDFLLRAQGVTGGRTKIIDFRANLIFDRWRPVLSHSIGDADVPFAGPENAPVASRHAMERDDVGALGGGEGDAVSVRHLRRLLDARAAGAQVGTGPPAVTAEKPSDDEDDGEGRDHHEEDDDGDCSWVRGEVLGVVGEWFDRGRGGAGSGRFTTVMTVLHGVVVGSDRGEVG